MPDEAVPLDPRGSLLAGRDATLEAALAWIDRRVGRNTATSLKLEDLRVRIVALGGGVC